MKNSILRGVFAASILLVTGSVAFGQAQGDNGTITASADVVQPVVVDGTKNLIFGNVTPGNDKSVSYTGVSSQPTGGEQAGEFTITKGSNTEASVAFTLPTVLDSGDNELAISFATDDARFSNSESLTAEGLDHLAFDPNQSIVLSNNAGTAPFFGSNAFWVYLGGTVAPLTGQPAGTYTADVILTVTYQ